MRDICTRTLSVSHSHVAIHILIEAFVHLSLTIESHTDRYLTTWTDSSLRHKMWHRLQQQWVIEKTGLYSQMNLHLNTGSSFLYGYHWSSTCALSGSGLSEACRKCACCFVILLPNSAIYFTFPLVFASQSTRILTIRCVSFLLVS